MTKEEQINRALIRECGIQLHIFYGTERNERATSRSASDSDASPGWGAVMGRSSFRASAQMCGTYRFAINTAMLRLIRAVLCVLLMSPVRMKGFSF